MSNTPSPVSSLNTTVLYSLLALLFVLIAVLFFLLPFLLKQRKKTADSISMQVSTRNSSTENTADWQKKVAQVVHKYHRAEISKSEAYTQLAAIARAFASIRLEIDLSTYTLTDLEATSPLNTQSQFETLQQTISSLYPAEFADAENNTVARDSNVETAAQWVDTMIKKWVA